MNKVLDIKKFSSSLSNQQREVFLSSGKTGTDCGPVLEFEPKSNKNWTNQELSEFYRVKDILAKYNISVIIDCGLTDELDPWCVYCNSSGDVFAHFCKIDNIYYLDSPKLIKPVTASNLRDLVSRFSSDEIENNKKLEDLKSNVVTLHPAILFTSLILALYVTTDAATSSVHAETLLPPDTDLIHLKPASLSEEASALHHPVKVSSGPMLIDEYKAIVKNFLAKLVQKEMAFYLSIASIAGISNHVVSSHNVTEHLQNLIPTDAVVSTSDGGSVKAKHGSDTADSSELQSYNNAPSIGSNDHSNLRDTIQVTDTADPLSPLLIITSAQTSTRSNDELALTITRSAPKDTAPRSMETGSLAPLTQSALSKVGMMEAHTELASSNERKAVQPAVIDQLKDGLVSVNINTSTISTVKITSSSDANFHILDSLSKVEGFNTILSFTGITDNSLRTDYSISSKSAAPSDGTAFFSMETSKPLLSPATTDHVASLPNAGSSNLSAYNDQVRGLIDFVLTKGDRITIVNLPMEVIFVDNTALSTATELVTARSWVTKDGGVISMVGFLKDMSDYKVLQS